MLSHPIVRAAICLVGPPSDTSKLGRAMRWAVRAVRPSPPDKQWRDKAHVVGNDLVVAYGSSDTLHKLEHLFPSPAQNPGWWRKLVLQSDQFLIDAELLQDEVLDPKIAPQLGRIRVIPDLLTLIDAGAGDHSPNVASRRGRPSQYNPAVDEQIAAAWAQAKAAGIDKKQFCRERGIRTAQLDRVLNRIRKRRSRSE